MAVNRCVAGAVVAAAVAINRDVVGIVAVFVEKSAPRKIALIVLVHAVVAYY